VRRGGAVHSLGAELIKRGAFVFSQILNTDAIEYLLGSHLELCSKRTPLPAPFCSLLPKLLLTCP
jgi:hypothetical protein